jgi:hypothetical protein
MDLTGFDFSQPASVLWFSHVSRDGQITAGESRPFSEVTDALRFIIEKLDGVNQATASIYLDKGSLSLTESRFCTRGLAGANDISNFNDVQKRRLRVVQPDWASEFEQRKSDVEKLMRSVHGFVSYTTYLCGL